MRSLLLLGAVLAGLVAGVPPSVADDIIRRQQSIRSLPGQLDAVLMVNDNNPELIKEDGILLSTFPNGGDASISVDLNGRFDLFSHHVYAGTDETLDSTLWLALLVAPIGDEAVDLALIEGSTSLSQATLPDQTAAPFLPLPALMRETSDAIAAGPGSRVAGDLLKGRHAPELSQRRWILKPGAPTVVLQLPIPVQGLDPLLNGRNIQLRLHSSAPVALATLAAHGNGHEPPGEQDWIDLLNSGELSGKEHSPSPRGSKGKIIYSRVSGVQVGSRWQARVTDPGSKTLSIQNEPLSWPISSLERGSLGTGQVQTAELQALYPATAWAAHGNYGVEYDLTLPLKNRGSTAQTLSLALESPLKTDQASNALQFRSSDSGPVMFRGPVEVVGLDDPTGTPYGRQTVHLVLRQGQEGPSLGQVRLGPGEARDVQIRLIYPADATPPQVLTVRPVKQS